MFVLQIGALEKWPESQNFEKDPVQSLFQTYTDAFIS